MKLLTRSNTKTIKGEKRGYLTHILHLAPGNLSGHEVCGKRSDECFKLCLNTAGCGRFTYTQAARVRKTKWFFENRDSFMETLAKDIASAIRKANRDELTPVFRLNGTSDIPWESIRIGAHKNIFSMFPEVQFYDYTKAFGRKKIPANYHLTFSRSESNDAQVKEALRQGMNVAVVFNQLPETYMGKPVINGDEDDLRFLDQRNSIIGLTAKGKAKDIASTFVVGSTSQHIR